MEGKTGLALASPSLQPHGKAARRPSNLQPRKGSPPGLCTGTAEGRDLGQCKVQKTFHASDSLSLFLGLLFSTKYHCRSIVVNELS